MALSVFLVSAGFAGQFDTGFIGSGLNRVKEALRGECCAGDAVDFSRVCAHDIVFQFCEDLLSEHFVFFVLNNVDLCDFAVIES